jgi:hypothetical protein
MPADDASDREIMPELVEAMRAAGISAEFIYAYKKTGYILLSDPSQQKLPEGAEEMWHAAIREYFELENEAACGASN